VTEAPQPRLAPLPRDQWSDDVVGALNAAFPPPVVDRFMATDPGSPGVPTAISTMLHHPALAGPWLAYNNVLLWSPAVEPRLRELMVLRVAWCTRAPYEWAQHVKLAERYGVTSDDVDAIGVGPGHDRWTDVERDVIAATDELLDHTRIADETWQRLAAHFDERQLVELVFIVGTYVCLAMAFNSFGLQLESSVDTSNVPPLPE
jgi:alkylhydroperoxidase family enzyme